ncbi:MAG: hypothetical protein P8X42_08585 [Calditrichaceae bacterium]
MENPAINAELFAVSSMQQAVGSKQQKLEQLPVWTPDRSDFAFYNSSAGFLINDLPPVWSPPDRPNIYRGLMPAHYRAAPGNIQRSQSVKPEGGFAYWRTGFLLLFGLPALDGFFSIPEVVQIFDLVTNPRILPKESIRTLRDKGKEHLFLLFKRCFAF